MSAIKIVMGSNNPVKLEAVRYAFKKMFPASHFQWETIDAPSGVSEQPASDVETYQGAVNRVQYIHQIKPEADYWCSIEGGIEFDEQGNMRAFAWVVVQHGQKRGYARSAAFYLPAAITELVKSGMELGEADDIVFQQANSKQKNGAVGLLTGNVLTRTTLYGQAAIMALIPFKNPTLY